MVEIAESVFEYNSQWSLKIVAASLQVDMFVEFVDSFAAAVGLFVESGQSVVGCTLFGSSPLFENNLLKVRKRPKANFELGFDFENYNWRYMSNQK